MSLDEVSDEELVRRLREGDDEAGSALFGRLFPVLRPGLRRRMGPDLRKKVAESDLIQSAYASVLRHLPEFRDRGSGSFRRWVGGILDHKRVDQIRRYATDKRKAVRETPLAALSEGSTPRARGATPSAAAIAGEDIRRIRAAVELLSPDHRAVVRWVHEKSLTVEEAAGAMGRSPEAVRKLYARAVERLTVILRKETS